jgi:hypothetical protein
MRRWSLHRRDVRSAGTLATGSGTSAVEAGIERAARALVAPRRLADEPRRHAGAAPRHIARAIVDFDSQIAASPARLGDIPPPRRAVVVASVRFAMEQHC